MILNVMMQAADPSAVLEPLFGYGLPGIIIAVLVYMHLKTLSEHKDERSEWKDERSEWQEAQSAHNNKLTSILEKNVEVMTRLEEQVKNNSCKAKP